MILAEILSDKVVRRESIQVGENEFRYTVLVLLTGIVFVLGIIALALLAPSKR
jgi:hypothetical protein